ncbi:hypothetical protein CF326_g385 [Tilletia indica]|nr:hypothetical protein CF326_g385 [Tilletia indica]
MADPFAERHTLDANPFADPAIQGALHSSSRAYEPAGSANPYGQQDDDDDVVSKATGNSAQNVNKMEELARRERELEQRERDLNARAAHIQRHGRNNFPPFYPMLYHDIDAEIPPDSRPLVATVFKLWLLLVLSLIVNLVATVFLLVQSAPDGGKDMISGIVYLPVITAASFMLWYRPMYNAYMKESSVFYYMYFVLYASQIRAIGQADRLRTDAYISISGFSRTQIAADFTSPTQHTWYSESQPPAQRASSIPSSPFKAVDFSFPVIAAILGTIATIGFAVQGLGNLWFYRITWNHNHEQGHTFAQAKQEFATHGARAYFTRS